MLTRIANLADQNMFVGVVPYLRGSGLTKTCVFGTLPQFFVVTESHLNHN